MTRDTFDLFQDPERGRFGDSSRDAKQCDLTMVFHHDTPAAMMVSDDGDESRAIWLPKSQARMERTGKEVTGHRRNGQSVRLPQVTVTCPQWLAEERGLI